MKASTPGFAAGTSVSVEKTKAELDALLGKHGASSRGVLQDDEHGVALVAFTLLGRQYRVTVPLPVLPDARPTGWRGWPPPRRAEWEAREKAQHLRTRWRCLLLLVKAKLEVVRMGASTYEREFMADLVLPGGRTVAEAVERALSTDAPVERLLTAGGAA